jgi:hypothetical protein
MKLFMNVMYKNGQVRKYEIIPKNNQNLTKEQLEKLKDEFKDTVIKSYSQAKNSNITIINEYGWEIIVNVLDTSLISLISITIPPYF